MDEPAQLSTDDLFSLLASSRRRIVVMALDARGSLSAGELAECVAAEELGVSADDVNPYERKRVYISLYQAHLPKMVDWGVLDESEDEYLLTEQAADLRWYIENGPRETSVSQLSA